jgi:hypothetical protein
MPMVVSVENVFYFLHLNLVAVQQHPQNLMEEHHHLKLNYIKKKEREMFPYIPGASSGGGLSLLS